MKSYILIGIILFLYLGFGLGCDQQSSPVGATKAADQGSPQQTQQTQVTTCQQPAAPHQTQTSAADQLTTQNSEHLSAPQTGPSHKNSPANPSKLAPSGSDRGSSGPPKVHRIQDSLTNSPPPPFRVKIEYCPS